MARLFDAYIMVDWSASATPVTGANSVWVGVLARDARLKFQFRAVNPDTRPKARTFIADMVEKLTKRGDKVLLGFDFSLGYPAGTAKALRRRPTDTPDWRLIWKFLTDRLSEKEGNGKARDRFAVAAGLNYAISQGPFPFWGAPKSKVASTLGMKKTPFDDISEISEFRNVERYLREQKIAHPKSSWQLGGAGSVGSQSMMGIPHVDWLSKNLPNAKIWPFELGLEPLSEEALSDVKVVIAEIYPSMVQATPTTGQVLDAAQVEAIARHYYELDRNEELGPLFGGRKEASETEMSQICCEEGWILGA